MLSECYKLLLSLKIENISILTHPRKTFAVGFLSNINSIKILFEILLIEFQFKYFLTCKLSQDHLELFFSCIRARSGNNNNPNVKQFQWALRKLMFRNSVCPSEGSNCIAFDEILQNSIINF